MKADMSRRRKSALRIKRDMVTLEGSRLSRVGQVLAGTGSWLFQAQVCHFPFSQSRAQESISAGKARQIFNAEKRPFFGVLWDEYNQMKSEKVFYRLADV